MIARLNRAIVVAELDSPQVALVEVDNVQLENCHRGHGSRRPAELPHMMMEVDAERSRARLTDAGGYVSAWLAPALMPVWYGRRGAGSWTREEIRAASRDWPEDGLSVGLANAVRTSSWFAIALAALAGVIVLGLSGGPLGIEEHPLRLIAMDIFGLIIAYSSGVGLVNALKWAASWQWMERLDRSVAADRCTDGPVQRERGWLLRVCLPTNLDLVLALAWAMPASSWMVGWT